MKYEIVQMAPYPTAEFICQAKCGDIGTAKRIGNKKTLKIEIQFNDISLQMIYDKSNESVCSMIKDLFTFSPYTNLFPTGSNVVRFSSVKDIIGCNLMSAGIVLVP